MQPRLARRCICLICRGRGFCPGALSSTKQIFPPGRMMILSGMPAFAGLVSFGAIPPAFLVARTRACSMVFSSIVFLSGAFMEQNGTATLLRCLV